MKMPTKTIISSTDNNGLTDSFRKTRYDVHNQDSSLIKRKNVASLSRTHVVWTNKPYANPAKVGNGYNLFSGSQNLEEVLGGNFKSINLGFLPKTTEFESDSQIEESVNENNNKHEYSSYGKIYEEDKEGMSSSNCNEQSSETNLYNSTRNFFVDPNIQMSNAKLRPMSKNHIDFSIPIRQQEITNTRKKNETIGNINRKSDDSEFVCKINSRVKNAIKRIEKKYCHKNTLPSNEYNNAFDKLNVKSPFEKIDIFEESKNNDFNKSNNQIHPSKIQSTSLYNFDTSKSRNFKANPTEVNILQSDLMSDYNRNKGFDYLEKLKQDEKGRLLKNNHDMEVLKDKIFELQNISKENNSNLRNTFYNCLEDNNKYKEKHYYQMNPNIQKLVNINNSGYKYDMNESKFSVNNE